MKFSLNSLNTYVKVIFQAFYSFIQLQQPLNPVQGVNWSKLILGTLGVTQEYTQHGMPVHHRALI